MYYDALFFRQLKSIIKNAIIHPQKICPFICGGKQDKDIVKEYECG